MNKKRSLLTPSDAATWMKCTAKPVFIREQGARVKEPPEGVAARKGTLFHGFGAHELDPDGGHLEEEKPHELPRTERATMLENAKKYADFVYSKQPHQYAELLIENGFSLPYDPDFTGTCDAAWMHETKIVIMDAKHGVSAVSAYKNKQLAIYAMSLLSELEMFYSFPDSLPLEIWIYQPHDPNGQVEKNWFLTLGELRYFFDHINDTAERILAAESSDELEFRPHPDTCHFCPARFSGVCTAYNKMVFGSQPKKAVKAMAQAFEGGDVRKVLEDAPEFVTKIIENRPAINAWLDSVYDYEYKKATSGNPSPQFKLVAGKKGNRRWKNESTVEKALWEDFGFKLRQKASVEKVLSPNQTRSLFLEHLDKGKKEWGAFEAEHVTRPEGNSQLALVDDPRPALYDSPADMFNPITEDDI